HVEIAVGPAVETLADAGSERVVDGGMAERALDAHALDAAVAVRESRDADHRIQFEQGDGGCRVVQVHLAGGDLLLQCGGEGIGIYPQTDGKSRLGRYARPHAAVFRPSNGLVQLELAAPECFASERVVAKDLPALLQHAVRITLDGSVEVLL